MQTYTYVKQAQEVGEAVAGLNTLWLSHTRLEMTAGIDHGGSVGD